MKTKRLRATAKRALSFFMAALMMLSVMIFAPPAVNASANFDNEYPAVFDLEEIAPTTELIAHFDFEGLTAGSTVAIPSLGGLDAQARPMRAANTAHEVTLSTNVPTNGGTHSYSLGGTGTSGQRWLSVVKNDGTPLLRGTEGFIVTFDVRRETGHWPFYVDHNLAANSGGAGERYIGVHYPNNTTLNVERFSFGRPGDAFNARGTVPGNNVWYNVAIVARAYSTALYINGNLVQSRATAGEQYILPNLFGADGGHIQLGKANWGAAGEFFTGQIDNVKIYNGAEFFTIGGTWFDGDVLPASFGGMPITWTSSDGISVADGRVVGGDRLKEVELTAVYGEFTKSFMVYIMPNVSAAAPMIYAYVDPTQRAEVGYSMHYAILKDNALLPLNFGEGILFAPADFTDTARNSSATAAQVREFDSLAFPDGIYNWGGKRVLENPWLFRMADGKIGVVAQQRAYDGEALPTNRNRTLFFWTTENLLDFDYHGWISFGAQEAVVRPQVELEDGVYYLTWEAGASIREVSTTDFATFTAVIGESTRERTPVPNLIRQTSCLFEVTPAEIDFLTKKLLPVANIDADNSAAMEVAVGADLKISDLPQSFKAYYSDTSEADMPVIWDANVLDEVSTDVPGTYTVKGKAAVDEYPFPFIRNMADPMIIKYEDSYLYIATWDGSGSGINTYQQTLRVRRSDTLMGLLTATESIILDHTFRGGVLKWAPEFHIIDGTLSILFATGTVNAWNRQQAHIMQLKDGGDPLVAADWTEPVFITRPDGRWITLNESGLSIDMTVIEDSGTYYYVWSQRFVRGTGTADNYIARFDPKNPTQLLEMPILLSRPTFGWERPGDSRVQEGQFMIRNGDRLFMTYSGAAVNATYAVGVMEAKVGTDLTKLENWIWTGYPILTSRMVPGENGPGHNAYVKDEFGREVNVYHAFHPASGGARHTGLRTVHWGFDGMPVLNMTPERQLLPQLREFTLTIEVTGDIIGADKSGLVAVIRNAPSLQGTYTDISWQVFQSALAVAIIVRDNAAASQESVDAALTALLTAINNLERVIVDPKPQDKTLIAGFDFESNPENSVFIDPETGARAVITGTPAYGTNQLDGSRSVTLSSSFWMELTKADGSPLLKGLDEFTVSYDVSSTAATGNNRWAFFAARTLRAPKNSWEMYLGIQDRPTNVTVERFYNSGARPAFTHIVPAPSGWRNVEIVFGKNSTSIYVNGKFINSQDSNATIEDILGKAGGFAYIGRSNWGEFFNGQIDNFMIWAPGDPDDAGKVAAAKAELTLPYNIVDKQVYGNIHLPKTGLYGAAIIWETSHPDIVDVNEYEIANYDPRTAGVVTRPGVDTVVTMTALISSGAETDTKVFQFTVKAAPEPLAETDAYVFVYFTGREGAPTDEQVYFALSEDAATWSDLRPSGRPVLSSDKGDRGVRDPWIVRAPEGDKFYLIGTDLNINRRGGWGAAGWQFSSTKLAIWESNDMVNWSDVRLVDVASGILDAGMAWAPEAVYDEATGDYFVFWATLSTRDPQHSAGNPTVFYSRTRDFHTFTEPTRWMATNDIIDTSAIQTPDGHWYRATQTGNIRIDRSLDTVSIGGKTYPSLTGAWQTTGNLQSIFSGAWTYGSVEGPELFLYNEKDWNGGVPTYGVYVDRYGQGAGYMPFYTTDLGATTRPPWFAGTGINMGPVLKRHGGIMAITMEEHDRIMEAFLDEAAVPDFYPVNYNEAEMTSDMDLLAFFDFNDLPASGSDDIMDATGNARAQQKQNWNGTGSVSRSTNTPEGTGYSYNLTGSRWLNVLKADGTPLLLDENGDLYEEIIVSYHNRRSSGHWAFYLDRNFTANSAGAGENYIGTLDSGSRITVERFRGGRPGASYYAIGDYTGGNNVWRHFVIVIRPGSTALYINGVLAGQAPTNGNTYKLSDILGPAGGLIQLGKANWTAGGEYHTGMIDNFKIFAKHVEIPDQPITSVTLPVPISPEQSVPQAPRTHFDAVTHTTIDKDNKKIDLVISRTNSGLKDLTAVPLVFGLAPGVQIVDLKTEYDLTTPLQLVLTIGDEETMTWTISAILGNNPVIRDRHADPDMLMYKGKYYMYTTTDAFPGWAGFQFKVFSSEDMIDWEDEGVILDMHATAPYKNIKGVDVCPVPWARDSAWAPAIAEKDGKFYFYFSGHWNNTNVKEISVAWADHPAGPYQTLPTPMLTLSQIRAQGVTMGQAIDPQIFMEDDGTYYMLFGNGNAAIVQLGDDMISWVPGTMRNYVGATNFREAIMVNKIDDIYHFTWSCDDTGSPNYHVRYGISDNLYGPILHKGVLLQRDDSKGILGPAHHEILYHPFLDEYFMIYHRFFTPLGQDFAGGTGNNRETCIDRLEFKNGQFQPVQPTHTGITTPIPATDKTVDTLEITGIIPPGSGTPTTRIDVLQYSGTVEWAGGTATITILPRAGYTIEGVAADSFKVAGAQATNAANSVVITAVFEAVACDCGECDCIECGPCGECCECDPCGLCECDICGPCEECCDCGVHVWIDNWTVTTAPTCTAAGVETRICNAEGCAGFQTRPVAALGHNYVAVVTAPTCMVDGITTHTCSRCSDSFTDSNIPSLGHNWTDWSVTTAPTCTTAGVETRICIRDGCTTAPETRPVAALGHTFGAAADCTTAQTCTVCNEVLAPILGHDYVAVVTAPTCTAAGFTTHTCSRCGNSYTDSNVPALGHTPRTVTNTFASCTEAGLLLIVCDVCSVEITRTIRPPTGHTPITVTDTQPTATEDGLLLIVCDICSVEITRTVRPAIGQPGAIVGVNNARFLQVSNSNRITTVTFTVNVILANGSNQVRTYTFQEAANNNNIDGRFIFPPSHELAGRTLTYDIKGNGSNIKAFVIR